MRVYENERCIGMLHGLVLLWYILRSDAASERSRELLVLHVTGYTVHLRVQSTRVRIYTHKELGRCSWVRTMARHAATTLDNNVSLSSYIMLLCVGLLTGTS